MKKGIYIKLTVAALIIVIAVFLQNRSFWIDLKEMGIKDSVIVLTESFSCVQEGEVLSATFNHYRKSCCKGLTKISLDKPSDGKYSINGCTVGTLGGVLCTNCGDGVCGSGENKCNCQKDCGS